MNDLVVRAATQEDLEHVVALDRATELLPHWTEADYVATLTGAEGSVRRCLFVASSASANASGLAGFAVGMTATAGEDILAELESVAVASPARRQGVASALCAEVIAWARLRGATQIDLEVRSHSAGAIRLYEGLGFVFAGRRAAYYTGPADDAVLMRRSF